MLLSWVICRASPGASLSGPGTVSVDTRQSHWPQGSLTGQSSRGSLAPAMLCSIPGPGLEHSVHDGVRAGFFLGIGSGTLFEFQRGGGSSNRKFSLSSFCYTVDSRPWSLVNARVVSRQQRLFLAPVGDIHRLTHGKSHDSTDLQTGR